MIHETLEYIRREIRDRLPIADAEVMIESAHALSSQNNAKGAYITLVNVEEEPVHRNLPSVNRVGGAVLQEGAPIRLNIYLLFSFDFQTYGTSLLHLSNTIGLFQDRPFYAAADGSPGNPFPPELEKLIFELYSMDFEALNNLWGVMGGAYFPSVVYKVGMVHRPGNVRPPLPFLVT